MSPIIGSRQFAVFADSDTVDECAGENANSRPGRLDKKADLRNNVLFIPKGAVSIRDLAVHPYSPYALPAFGTAVLILLLGVRVLIRRWSRITPSLAANEILGAMGDSVFVCNTEGRIQFVNRAAESILGYRQTELIGRKIEDYLALDDRFSRSFGRISSRNAEHVFISQSGERIDMMLSIAPVIKRGEAAGAVLIGRDMRTQKKAQREVRKAVTLLQSTLDSTADGILAIGDGGKVLTYNQRFLDMWKIPAEVIEKGDDGLIISQIAGQLSDPEEFVRTVDLLYSQPEAESFSMLEFRDGRRFERYSIGRSIEDVANIRVWSFRDVSARYAAEAALRESELKYRLLFEQNAAGVCVANISGDIIDCNDMFAAMLGYRRLELIGTSVDELHQQPEERKELLPMLQDVQTLNSVELQFRRRDGQPLWVLQNLALVGTGSHAVVHSTVVDISDRKRAEEQIEYHAYHDILTGLPNRKMFTDRLSLGITRSRRSGLPMGVMFIDLDHFKNVNDTLGHTAGDELLLEMAQRLRACVRDDDTVARLGGDEFTIILSELRHPEHAATVAEKVLRALHRPLSLAGSSVEMTASIGIAIFPDDGTTAEALLRNADSAMYRAKDLGRSNYQLCTDDMKHRATERLSLDARLRRAILENQLVVQYQPQISLVTGRITGCEALVRWNDPDRGLIAPAGFIPFAEESRLIVPLGEWVLRTACLQASEWRRNGSGPARVSVNLSARQFHHHDLAGFLARTLSEAKLDPSALELEITETTAMQDGDATVEVLRHLRDLGVMISIDDFGMGYSSLSYLKRFAINAVKIDREFVRDIVSDQGDAAIVTAVIAIARSLKLRVVAEGVETAEQLAFLQRGLCDEVQGFFFSSAVDPLSLTQVMGERLLLPRNEPRIRIT